MFKKLLLLLGASAVFAVILWAAVGSKIDFTTGTTPGNPASGKVRLWANSGTGKLECLTSAGAACFQPADLTTATGVLPGISGGGLVLVEEHTASTSATLAFSTCFSATYDTYRITFTNLVPATNGADLYVRLNADSGSNYSWTSWVFRAGPASGGGGSTADTQFTLDQNGVNNAGTVGYSGDYTFYDMESASLHKSFAGTAFYRDNEGTPRDLGVIEAGQYLSTSAVTSMTVLQSSGNITSGTVRCYGLAK